MDIGKHHPDDGFAVFVALLVCVVLAVIGATALSIQDNQAGYARTANLHLPVK